MTEEEKKQWEQMRDNAENEKLSEFINHLRSECKQLDILSYSSKHDKNGARDAYFIIKIDALCGK